MLNTNAYKEWRDLFDENVSNVWQEESIPVLKKLAMILFCIKKEIKEIQDEVDKDVSHLRKNVIKAQLKQNFLSEFQFSCSSNDKENVERKRIENTLSQSNRLSENTVDSPEMFQNNEAPLSGSNDSGSIIISDEDTANTLTSGSPEIKKKKRNRTFPKRLQRDQRLKDSNTCTMNLFRNITGDQKLDNGSGQNDEHNQQLSIIDDKSSMDFFKGLIVHTQRPENPTKENLLPPCDIRDVTSKEQDLVLTPLRNNCDIDSSVVQCTPLSVSLPKRKSKISSYLSKNKYKRENGTTLTQMFSKCDVRKDRGKVSRLQGTNCDSDETCINPSYSNASSVMGITRMVSYLNTKSPLKEKENAGTEQGAQSVIILDSDIEEIASIVGDVRYEDFEDDTSLNSAIVEENENVEAAVPFKLNEFLAKVQNVPDHQLEAEPVIRGKARKKLPAWSCKDCEKFYVKQGLNLNDMLALSKCSKHRGYNRPREDTLPGFWDMNLDTQETENTN